MNECPDPKLIDRAVEIWKRLLSNPVYDNGDKSFTGFMTKTLAERLPSNATQEKLEAFGLALRGRLLTPNKHGYYDTVMDVDYGPSQVLAEAAEAAELKMEFPWKTTVSIRSDCVGVSAGYGAEYVYHYPLPSGGWLVTTLHGSDISKVIAYVEGEKPDFSVEPAETPA